MPRVVFSDGFSANAACPPLTAAGKSRPLSLVLQSAASLAALASRSLGLGPSCLGAAVSVFSWGAHCVSSACASELVGENASTLLHSVAQASSLPAPLAATARARCFLSYEACS